MKLYAKLLSDTKTKESTMYQMNLEKLELPKTNVSATLYVSTLDNLRHHAQRRGNALNILIRSAINDLLDKLDEEEKELNDKKAG